MDPCRIPPSQYTPPETQSLPFGATDVKESGRRCIMCGNYEKRSYKDMNCVLVEETRTFKEPNICTACKDN